MADQGTVSATAPGRPPRLTHEELQRAQADTLESPRRRYGIAARDPVQLQPQIKFFWLPQAIA